MSAVVDDQPSWLAQIGARSQDVLADPTLRDLPYEVETHRGGPLIMRPAKHVHGVHQGRCAGARESSAFDVDIAGVAYPDAKERT